MTIDIATATAQQKTDLRTALDVPSATATSLALAGKVNTGDLTTALADKADATATSAALADKADTAAVTAALLTKADTASSAPVTTGATGNKTLILDSPTDRLADTSRLRILSRQKQEPENNQDGGETAWFDLADPRAKSMLTWRIQYDPVTRLPYPVGTTPANAPYRRLIWVGAHWFAQDQADDNNPTEVHGHWSVETPDNSLALRTRLEISYINQNGTIGADKTLIQSANADFVVDCSDDQVFRLRTGAGAAKAIEWANDEWGNIKRWRLMTDTAETGTGNVGTDISFQRYNDAGTTALDKPFHIARSNGKVTVGGLTGTASGLQVNRASGGSAVTVTTNFAGGTGAIAYNHNALESTGRSLQFNIGADTNYRFVMFADGKCEWGAGAAARDVTLYREKANVLKTDTALKTGAYTTATRPSASTMGVSAQIYDTTLGIPIWSNGTNWTNAMGTVV